MDILDFKPGDFRNLSRFLGYFASAIDGAKVTDEQVVKWFVAVNPPHIRKRVLDETPLLLTIEPFPAEFVSRAANCHFETVAEARDWLQQIRSLLKSVRVEGKEAREKAVSSIFPHGSPIKLSYSDIDLMNRLSLTKRKPGKPRWKDVDKSSDDK